MIDGSGVMVYVWLSDGDDVLNVHLIRHGAFPGGVMQDHVAAAQRMKQADALLDDEPLEEEEPRVQRFVTDAEYEAFIARIIAAEELAFSEKLGVYSESASQGR